jgi:hypothetical protein
MDKSALEAARDLLRQRDAYRGRLLEELRAAEEKVVEIKSVLDQLGGSAPLAAPAAGGAAEQLRQALVPPPVPTMPTTPELVAAVLRSNGRPMTSGEIARAVNELRSDIARSTIFPAIYRMINNGRLIKRGTRLSLGEANE